MAKIRTILKKKMKNVRQRSPSLIDEMVLAIEQLLTTNKGGNDEKTKTLHQERKGQV